MKQNGSSRILDMTSGSVRGKLLLLAWPVILSHLLQTLYNLADAFWLGKLGRQALTAPTITMHVFFIAFAVAMGLGAAGTTLVSQFKGAGDTGKASQVGGQLLILLTGVGLVFGIAGYFLTPQILNLLKTPADSWQLTYDYMRWIFTGFPLLFIFFVYQGISTGLGDTIGPMQANVIAVVVNLILDPILIFGLGPFPEMGVVGAAVATVFSRALASFIGMYRLFRGNNGIKITSDNLKPDTSTLKQIMKIGLPVSLGQLGTSLGFTFMIGIVNSFGSAVTAAFGVGNRIIHMAFVPAMGLSQANATAVGQNLGAGNFKRAERSSNTALLLIGLILLPIVLIMFFFGADISKAFVDDPEVIEIGRTMFQITTPSVFIFGFLMVLMGSFQGSGYTFPIMVINISRLWILRIPAAYLLAITFGMGPQGIWWAMFISNIIVTVIGWIWFKKRTWKTKANVLIQKNKNYNVLEASVDMD